MSLPAPVNSTETNFRIASYDNEGEMGPWDHNGSVYGLFYDDTNDTHEVWFSDTPTGTATEVRGESWSEADSANHPSGFTSGNQKDRLLTGARCGDSIYVVHPENSGSSTAPLAVDVFDMGSKIWGRTISSGPNRSNSSAGLGVQALVAPQETLRVTFNGTQVSGFDTARFVDVDLGAGTWGSSTIIHTDSGTAHYYPTGMLLGKTGRTHFFYVDDATNMYHRSRSYDGTFGSVQVVVTSGTSNDKYYWDLGAASYTTSDGEVKLAVPFNGTNQGTGLSINSDFYVAYADSAENPTWTTALVSTNPNHNLGQAYTKSCAFFGGILFYCFTGILAADRPAATNPKARDVYLATSADFGATWSTATLIFSHDTYGCFTPNIRGIDNGVGILFSVNEDVTGAGDFFAKPWYHEIAIDTCPVVTGGNYAYLT